MEMADSWENYVRLSEIFSEADITNLNLTIYNNRYYYKRKRSYNFSLFPMSTIHLLVVRNIRYKCE
jgi:hypothetical protein